MACRPSSLLRLGYLNGAEPGQRAIHEEHLDGDVRLHMRLGDKGDNIAPCELSDRVPVALGHHALAITRWKSSRMATTRFGSPLSMIVCSSGVKPLPRITTTMMSSST